VITEAIKTHIHTLFCGTEEILYSRGMDFLEQMLQDCYKESPVCVHVCVCVCVCVEEIFVKGLRSVDL